MYFKGLKRRLYTPAAAGLLFLGLVACRQEEKREEVLLKEEKVVVVVEEEDGLFTGRLYSSGLAEREVEALELEEPVFQLAGSQSYFISGSDSLRNYVGACLGVRGVVKEEWEENPERVRDQFTYDRLAIEAKEVVLLEDSACTGGYLPAEEAPGVEEVSSYRGRLRRMQRPAPDIAYDYQLVLNEPVRQEGDPVLPGRLLKDLPLVLFNISQVKAAEKAFAREEEVVVQGVLSQGYAGQKVLEVRQVEISN